MGFSIHYRSTETMHPAQAFEIKQHAEQLSAQFAWLGCEGIHLNQSSDGYLCGHSRARFFPMEVESEAPHRMGLPEGTVLSLAEVLCTLSREHAVDWDVCNEYEPEPIGQIVAGVVTEDLHEQLEACETLGELLDDPYDRETEVGWATDGGRERATLQEDDLIDDGPRLLKFPTIES